MKIAYLISEYLPSVGGAQVCIHNIARRLKGNNDEAVVITTTTGNVSRNLGYEIIRISHWFLKILRFPSVGKYILWYKLGGLQRRYNFDLWQVTIGYPLGACSVGFFRKKNIPCVLRCAGEDIQVHEGLSYGYRLSPRVDKMVRTAYPLFDRCVALSECVKAEYNKLGIPREKMDVIPNGVDLVRFRSELGKEEIKCKLGLQGKIVLLSVGRNHRKKGYDLIPGILQRVLEKRKEVVWVIIGKGCNEISTSGWSNEVRKRIILIDGINAEENGSILEVPSSELIEYYLGSDLFVLPSYIETFGMVLIEANAAGVPVVTSDAPGCRSVVKDGYNGLIAESGNSEMFAEKIIRLINDTALYKEICLNISENIRKYDWRMIADAYRRLYMDLIKGEQARRRK